ncbi:MAG: DNA-binding domain-containing protein, partial [Alphaproteobacteria bacterium]|nr:DNA-binding domain-containing protein [Alphaproteobacteria bacterium]
MPDYQSAFVEALLDPAKPVPAGLVRPDGLPAGRRFDIYRNNVVVALIEALGEAFPV